MQSRSQKSSLRNIKITLEYDGSRFFGFQRQKGKPTIQGELERALSILFNRPMKIGAAAGRTDAGVHARGQIVHFKVKSNLPLRKIQKALNALLPQEIAVKKIEQASLDFHARYHARRKTYEYLLWNSPIRSPLLNGKAFHYPFPLNIGEMRKAANMLLGRHHFAAFQASGSGARDAVRTISRLEIKKKGCEIRFLIEADGFLYHMVRSIVGTLLEVGRERLSLKDFSEIFKKKKRSKTAPLAPGRGLVLTAVKY